MSDEVVEERSENVSVPTDMSDELVEVRHKFSLLPIFKEPLCLIQNDANGSFLIVEEVLDQISQIDLTVNVIAIAGPYRTGKSYLMNRLAKAKHGFALGNQVTAKTKGVWAWCLMHPVHKDQVMLLLDTEGTGDAEKKDSDNENKLLCITALICSTFIYNLKGVIDRDTLDKLGFITFFARNITRVDEPQNAYISEIGLYLPKFVLCLRDFSHDLDDKSPTEYFESCLTLQGKRSASNDHANYDQIRGCIRKFFVDRKCFIFDTPVAGRKKLASLEDIDDKDILESFRDDIDVFMRNIYEYKPKKLLDDKCLNGNMFSSLVKTYVHKISTGGMPCIQDALSTMASQENKIIHKKVVKEFELKISSIKLPVYDKKEFETIYQEMQKKALQEFRAKCILTVEIELLRETEKYIEELCKKVVDKNTKIQKERCSSTIKEKYNSVIKKRLNEGQYRNMDGYIKFKEDIRDLKSEIKQSFSKMDETLLNATFSEFEDSYLDDEMLAMKMSKEYRQELKEMEDKKKTWERQNALNSSELQEKNKNIEILLEMLTVEEKANKSTVSRTLLRGASSLLPVFGPMIYEAVEGGVTSKRQEARKEKIKEIKMKLQQQSSPKTESEDANTSKTEEEENNSAVDTTLLCEASSIETVERSEHSKRKEESINLMKRFERK